MENTSNHFYLTDDPQIPDIINFDKYFPILMKTLSSLQTIMEVKEFGKAGLNPKKYFYKQKEVLLPLFNDELHKVLPDNYWQTLSNFSQGNIAVHTINVLYRTIED